MKVKDINLIIRAAVAVKEKSDDPTFAEVLQTQIEAFLSKVEQIMGNPIDALSATKKVPKEIEEAANKLNECHSLGLSLFYYYLFPDFSGFF